MIGSFVKKNMNNTTPVPISQGGTGGFNLSTFTGGIIRSRLGGQNPLDCVENNLSSTNLSDSVVSVSALYDFLPKINNTKSYSRNNNYYCANSSGSFNNLLMSSKDPPYTKWVDILSTGSMTSKFKQYQLQKSSNFVNWNSFCGVFAGIVCINFYGYLINGASAGSRVLIYTGAPPGRGGNCYITGVQYDNENFGNPRVGIFTVDSSGNVYVQIKRNLGVGANAKMYLSNVYKTY